MTDLAALVHDTRLKRTMSMRDVAAQSRGLLSHSTISRIEMGDYSSSTEKTLKGLHFALDLPMAKLRDAAGTRARVPAKPFILPEDADRMTARQRRVVRELISTFVASQDGA